MYGGSKESSRVAQAGYNYPQMDQVEEIKHRLGIVEVVGSVVKLKPAGRNHKGLCPFHNEKTPSFMVNPELGIYKCFGCGKGGDIFSFIQEYEKVDFTEALGILAERAGVVLQKSGFDSPQKQEVDHLLEIHNVAADYFHYLLTQHPVGEPARLYLAQRKVSDRIIQEFRLGFALNTWDGLYQYLVVKKKFSAPLLEKAGLLTKSSKGTWLDRFRGRVIFPLADHRGRVVGFAGRVLPTIKQLGEFDPPKYINSPETAIYHKSKMLFGLFQAKPFIRTADRVILVEGELDMISSFASGVGETVAIKGTALTEDQILLLSRLTKNLVLSLDADTAGDTATKRSILLAETAGMNIKVVHISGGKDPDEIARENPKLWKEMIAQAVDIYQFYIDSAVAKFGTESIEAKKAVSQIVLPILAKIENKVVQAHYLKFMAQLLAVSEEVVQAEMNREARKAAGLLETPVSRPEVKHKAREELLQEDLLRLAWSIPLAMVTQTQARLDKLVLTGAVGKILKLWFSRQFEAKSDQEAEVVDFIRSLPEELRQVAGDLYLQVEEVKEPQRQLEQVLGELEQTFIKGQLESLVDQIKEAESQGDRQRVAQLEQRLVQISHKRKG